MADKWGCTLCDVTLASFHDTHEDNPAHFIFHCPSTPQSSSSQLLSNLPYNRHSIVDPLSVTSSNTGDCHWWYPVWHLLSVYWITWTLLLSIDISDSILSNFSVVTSVIQDRIWFIDYYFVAFRLFGSTGYCSACSKMIPAFEMVMRAKGNVYHLECFACQQCNHRLVGFLFTLFMSQSFDWFYST